MKKVSHERTIRLRPFSLFGPAFRADGFWLLGVLGGRLGSASLRGRQRDSARAPRLWESSAKGHGNSGNEAQRAARPHEGHRDSGNPARGHRDCARPTQEDRAPPCDGNDDGIGELLRGRGKKYLHSQNLSTRCVYHHTVMIQS
jgi:hypothetical protein